jgi:hypothetical protein
LTYYLPKLLAEVVKLRRPLPVAGVAFLLLLGDLGLVALFFFSSYYFFFYLAFFST